MLTTNPKATDCVNRVEVRLDAVGMYTQSRRVFVEYCSINSNLSCEDSVLLLGQSWGSLIMFTVVLMP
jgi:hypothetical protein